MFSGFPAGKLRVTPLPDLFFSELLPQIDDLAELKLTLHILWRLAHQPSPLCLSHSQLRADSVLRRSLGAHVLDDALQRAVQRGTFIELHTHNQAGQSERWYFANSESGRREATKARSGQLRLQQDTSATISAQAPTQSNLFALYEQHVGLLTPLIAEQLQEAAQTYPAEWLSEAFEIAVKQGKRHWRYIETILQRWAREGRNPSATRSSRTPAPALKRKR